MQSIDIEIHKLIEKIDNGELSLPEMQRGYVWKAKQVGELLDSLYRNYPSGTILTWEAGAGVPTRDFAVEQTASKQSDNNGQSAELLLDGQQRLTSLLAILKGKFVTVRDKPARIDTLFNLRHPDIPDIAEDIDTGGDFTESRNINYDKMTFAIAKPILKKKKYWISVSEFFQSPSIEEFLKSKELDSSDSWIQKYRERLAKLKNIENYKYRVDILESSASYGVVTEIFVRVNSQGTKLRSSDLALAQITAKWPGSLEIFEEFAEECTAKGFDFDLGIHIKNLVVFATGQSKFSIISRIPEQTLKNSWEIAKDGMLFSLDFLKNNVGIENAILLGSPFAAITIAYYAHNKKYKLSDEDEKKLKRWVLLASLKGRYSRGSTVTILDKDLLFARKDAESAPQKMLEDLEIQAGTLDIRESELKDRKADSAYSKAVFMAFREAGARDWHSRTIISLNNSGKQKLESHHIFPKAILKDNFEWAEINDIANLAFISSKTNNKISGREPTVYIKDIDGYKELFAQQCIPFENGLLELENYTKFLQKRRELMAKRLNEFLGNEDS